jgi:hypothetical protein
MKRFLFGLAALLAPLTTGCTGLTQGENNPGADTWLGSGAIAVDDRTETSFVLKTEQAATGTGGMGAGGSTSVPTSLLWAVEPDSGHVRQVADLSGRADPRILFPASGLLVMSEGDGKDRLDLYDNETLAKKKTVDESVRFNGTRMSPSRKFVAVADNTSDKAPIHIIETDTLAEHVVPHDGDWLEAMWMNGTDTLVAVVFYDFTKPTAHARILSWSMEEVATGGYQPDASKFWPKPRFDIDLPGVDGDFLFSYTWVGVSPDDKTLVFPVRKVETVNMQTQYSYELIVLDTTTNELKTVPGGKGPVGFTPDGATIVSYGDKDMNGNQELWLVDAKTLAVDKEPVAIEGGLSFFVSHEGNWVVAAATDGKQRLVLYDVDSKKSTEMQGPGVGLDEFVSRIGHKEMWLVDSQALFKLDFAEGQMSTIATTFKPEHINILPKRDQLVLDDAGTNDLVFFNPATQALMKTVTLPAPEKH